MCTIGLSRQNNLIFKNRDKNVSTDEEVVSTNDYIAVRVKGGDYFSLGFNKHGCGFVSAAINSPQWTKLAGEGKKEEAAVLFEEETKGLYMPTKLISEMLPHVENIDDWITSLEEAKCDFRGYNIVLVDLKSAKIVETFKQIRKVRDLNDLSVITNHFLEIDYGARVYMDYPNSYDRYNYAKERLEKGQDLEDIFEMLKPKNKERRERIWRDGHFYTVSTSVISLSEKSLYYSQGILSDYKRITLQKIGD